MNLAYCGLNCDECPVYLATVNNDKEAQIRLAEDYTTDDCNFSKDDMYCLGCHSETHSEKMCGSCGIRNCAVKKPHNHCAECGDFPCPIVEKYLGINSDSMNNLKQLTCDLTDD